MDIEKTDLLTIDVGSRLKKLRQERGFSLRSVAQMSGLSTNALSMIERSLASPSVSTLYKISEALSVPITAFFRVEFPKQEIVLRRASQSKFIHFPNGKWIELGGEEYTGHLEPFILELEPGGSSGDNPLIHTGNEFVYCLEGELVYTIDDKNYQLNKGDCLIFNGQRKHSWSNPGDEKVLALLVLTGFEHGESPGEFHIATGMVSKISQETKGI